MSAAASSGAKPMPLSRMIRSTQSSSAVAVTLIVGTAAILNDLVLDRATQRLHFPFLLAGMGLLVWKLARDRWLSRRDGLVLIAGYALYLVIVTSVMLRG